MNIKPRIMVLLLGLLLSFPGAAAEYIDGSMRLVLHEESGRFSLYLLTESNKTRPLALFADQDPRTSFLSVMVNDRSYKMGDSSAFRTYLGGDERSPSLIFESSFLAVTEEFSFVRSRNSSGTIGISIKISLENRASSQVSVGARLLLDTNLGEGTSGFPFTTNVRTISSETLIKRGDSDTWWTDRNDKVSLSGSINTGSVSTGSSEDPDSIHFANWKKLSDVSWKAPFQQGRNFNFPPYSVGDSALCYYFEPRPLGRGEKCSFGFYLAVNDVDGFASFQQPGTVKETIQDLPIQGRATPDEQDLAALRELMARIDAHIASGSIAEEELAAIEFDLVRLRAKYGPGFNSR